MKISVFPRIRTFEQFRDAVYAFRLPRIILSALDLELFSHMGHRTWSVAALAKRVKTSQRGIEILCRNLASIGLLEKLGNQYRSSKVAQRYLNAHSPEFRGAYLQLLQRQWGEWSLLTTGVRTGRPLDGDEPETPEYRQSFSLAMHQRSLDSAKHVSQQLSLRNARSLLDLGGGPGTYALHFLKRNPSLRATVMDRPAALEVAKTLAQRNRLQSRVTLVPCDFLTQRIPGHYDVVWYSNVLHIYSPQENLKVFRNIKRRLTPGGRILIQDTFLEDSQGLVPLEANVFAVTMLLYTSTGNTYSLRDVQNWLKRAGFSKTKIHQLKPGTGDWEGIILEGQVES